MHTSFAGNQRRALLTSGWMEVHPHPTDHEARSFFCDLWAREKGQGNSLDKPTLVGCLPNTVSRGALWYVPRCQLAHSSTQVTRGTL